MFLATKLENEEEPSTRDAACGIVAPDGSIDSTLQDSVSGAHEEQGSLDTKELAGGTITEAFMEPPPPPVT